MYSELLFNMEKKLYIAASGRVNTNCYIMVDEVNKNCIIIDLPDETGEQLAEFCKQNGLTHVPIIDTEYILPKTMEEIKLEADGKSVINPKMRREGFVYRSKDGSISFKNVSREYLLKHS